MKPEFGICRLTLGLERSLRSGDDCGVKTWSSLSVRPRGQRSSSPRRLRQGQALDRRPPPANAEIAVHARQVAGSRQSRFEGDRRSRGVITATVISVMSWSARLPDALCISSGIRHAMGITMLSVVRESDPQASEDAQREVGCRHGNLSTLRTLCCRAVPRPQGVTCHRDSDGAVAVALVPGRLCEISRRSVYGSLSPADRQRFLSEDRHRAIHYQPSEVRPVVP